MKEKDWEGVGHPCSSARRRSGPAASLMSTTERGSVGERVWCCIEVCIMKVCVYVCVRAHVCGQFAYTIPCLEYLFLPQQSELSSSEKDKDSIAAEHLVLTNMVSFGLSEMPGASEASAISEQLRI